MTQSPDLQKLRELAERDRPRAYDLTNPDEVRRLHRECWGYLRTCHHKHGTDWEGRRFAMDALKALYERTP